MNDNKKIIAVVGLTGSGKTEVGHYIEKKLNYSFIRFGQVVLDIVKEKGLKPTETNEKPIREELRKENGPAAIAILLMPKIDKMLTSSKGVVADGLYSWSEYKVLKEKYSDGLIVIGVYASPETRYLRLEDRRSRYGDDPNLKYRSFSKKDAKLRDYNEIENIEKAGPIVMADYMIINEGTLDDLYKAVDDILKNTHSNENKD